MATPKFSFFAFSFCLFYFGLLLPAQPVDVEDLVSAQEVARGIASVSIPPPANRTKIDRLISTIIDDHSLENHSEDDSYFGTTDRTVIRRIILSILNDARSDHRERTTPTQSGERRRLEFAKTFSPEELIDLGIDPIGFDGGGSIRTNRVKIIFDITNVLTLGNYAGGGTITGYPIRMNRKW